MNHKDRFNLIKDMIIDGIIEEEIVKKFMEITKLDEVIAYNYIEAATKYIIDG